MGFQLPKPNDEHKPLLDLDESERERAKGIIKKAMKTQGVTQEDLCALLHISRTTFNNKLRDLSFTETELLEMRIHLGLGFDYLTGKTESNHFQEYESPEFIARIYDRLTPEKKTAATIVLLSLAGKKVVQDEKFKEFGYRVYFDRVRKQRHDK